MGGVWDGGGAEVTAEGCAGGSGQSEVPTAVRAHAAAAVAAAHLPAADEGASLASQCLRQGGLAVAGERESPHVLPNTISNSLGPYYLLS